jgi:hypothetical protein
MASGRHCCGPGRLWPTAGERFQCGFIRAIDRAHTHAWLRDKYCSARAASERCVRLRLQAQRGGSLRRVSVLRPGSCRHMDVEGWLLGSTVPIAVAERPRRAATVYDSVHDTMLLYGGRGGGQFYFDTCTWDGSVWKPVTTSGPPSLFGGPVIGLDPVSQRPLLFGMASGGASQTWSWDGARWQHLSPTHSPTARQAPSMALDAKNGRLIVFGGLSKTQGLLNDTWTWNGTDWIRLTPLTSPPPRFRASTGSMATRQIVVLWGGVTTNAGLGDAWIWDGTNWSQIASPGVRSDAAGIDTGSAIVFFGGDGPSGFYSDTQAFDGTTWSAIG